jgi:hypothetical protein
VNQLEAPVRELALLVTELDRQRDRYGRKEATKNTRALVLLGAASLLAAFHSSTPTSFYDWIPTGIACTAVILGVLALRPSKGGEISLPMLEKEIRGADDYRGELILYRSKVKVHLADLEHLNRRSRLVTVGFWVVLVGLAASVTVSLIYWIPEWFK